MLSDIFWKKLKQFFGEMPWHRIFFTLFLFSLPFSIRKILGVFSADGTFNEYMDVSVYFSDVLLVTTFLIYIFENKLSILSIEHWKILFHVEHLLIPIFIPFLFIFWSGLSIFWSENISLALFAFIKVVEGYFLYLYILASNVPRGTLELQPKLIKCSTWNIWQITFITIIISAFFQSIVAILQFIQQKSLGITILKESIFSIYDPGIAKVVINRDVFIRSYGFFPHPNILGGFLAISLIISTAYPLIFRYKLFHVEHSINIWLYRVLIFVQLLALLFSFSKSAILAFIIGFITLIFGINKMFHVEHLCNGARNNFNVPRGTSELQQKQGKCSTWNISTILQKIMKMFHVEHFKNTLQNEYLESNKRLMIKYLFRSILIEVMIIMLLDHYFWDIQQGQLLLWIILALAISKKD